MQRAFVGSQKSHGGRTHSLVRRFGRNPIRRYELPTPTNRQPTILGSAIFLVIAPGIVAGYMPWRICRWHLAAPLPGSFSLRLVGVLLIIAGASVLLFLRPLRATGPWYARADLSNAPFGRQRVISICP